MSRNWQFLIGVLVILAGALPARSQTPPITIDDVRIGYSADVDPDDNEGGHRIRNYLKSGFWTPVYVAITPGPEGIKTGRVVVETEDCDDVHNTYTTPLPSGGLPPNESYTAVTYVKIGSLTSELLIRVEADDRSRETRASPNSIGADDLLYLGIGSRLTGLKRTTYVQSQAEQMGPRAYVGVVDRDVRELPDRWFGYDTVDLALLCTSRRDFVTDLLNEREHRKEALAEWVRRGGRLVISCGHNQDMLNELLSRFQFDVPVSSSTPLHVESVTGLQGWLRSSAVFPAPDYSSTAKAAPVELARLDRKPGHQELEVLAPERTDDKSPPLVVRCPYGLGQIIIVAFDLDSGPFASWKGQDEFWKKLQFVTSTFPKNYDGRMRRMGYGGPQFGAENVDLVSSLGTQLEQFPNVSVVPFGWVAVFILIYIIIVGPLDYLFLKKVVKRLELTWITFPIVVIAVSVSAYYAAYYLKGSDLRINKVDLVDLDMEGRHSYGTTWFSLFSPRIQLYTIGIEPVSLAPPDQRSKIEPSTVVSWLSRPDNGFGGMNRPRSQGIFSRKYEFDTDARALKNVPIQVWTSKSFTASWDQALPEGRRPIRSTLQHREAGTGLEGSVTNDLPFALSDVAIIVREGGVGASTSVFTLGRLEPGQTGTIERGMGTARLLDWIGTSHGREPSLSGAAAQSTGSLMKQLMFHDVIQTDQQSNRLYRGLAQAWRPTHFDMAMLVASVPASEGPAESINGGSNTLSRLWLGEAPAPGVERPGLLGNLSQKTYVRAFLPLAQSSDAAAPDTKQ
jgi:hypothetical protein